MTTTAPPPPPPSSSPCWTFSLPCPPTADGSARRHRRRRRRPETPDADGDHPDRPQGGIYWTQPAAGGHPVTSPAPGTGDANHRPRTDDDDDDDNHTAPDDDPAEVVPFLSPTHEPTTIAASSKPHTTARTTTPSSGAVGGGGAEEGVGGWTWTSPAGHVVQSDVLLSATLRPAWHALPAVTTATSTAQETAAACRQWCRRILCGVCGSLDSDATAPDDTAATTATTTWPVTVTWRTADICSIRPVRQVQIPGWPSSSGTTTGMSRACRIALRPWPEQWRAANHRRRRRRHRTTDTATGTGAKTDELDDPWPTIPERWKDEWEDFVQQQAAPARRSDDDDDDEYDANNGNNSDWTRFTPDQHHYYSSSSPSGDANNDDDDPEKEEGPILWIVWPDRVGPAHHGTAESDPPLLWRVTWPACRTHAVSLENLTVFQGRYYHHQQQPQQPHLGNHINSDEKSSSSPTHIFINGYQSWSFCGPLRRGQTQPQPALPRTFSGAFNDGGRPPRTNASSYPYTSDFFTCLSSHPVDVETPSLHGRGPTTAASAHQRGGALVVGWLSQRHQFGVIQVSADLQSLAMHASTDGQIVHDATTLTANDDDRRSNDAGNSDVLTDWAYAQMVSPHHAYDQEPLVPFFHAVAAYNHARPLQNGNLLVGWCSWYHYYEKISEGVLRENFAKLGHLQHKVPMNVSVVDDGYMTAWGDWKSLKPRAFPSGSLATVARDIRRNHMRPGLWLAPFAADKHSQVARLHPDWIIRNNRGVPANSSNCGKFFYGLDATHPAVRKHAWTSIRRAVQEWEFTVLKIDFLYAACLWGNGKYDLTKSRAQAMHMALETIRQAAGPDTFLIGCGCPLASAIGYVDGMRVSADTGPTWYPAFPLPWWDHGTLPCLRSMMRNSLTRAPMGHRWWHNDPDCLLLGESTRLTLVEVASAASIVAMTCGMMLLSDDLTRVSLDRMRVLSKIFPMAGATAVVLDLHHGQGLPRLLRLWATDRYSDEMEFARASHLASMPQNDSTFNLEHASATFFGRQASFNLDHDMPPPNERKRSCIHVCQGLGTWTIVSLSNWSDQTTVLEVPPAALLPPPATVFDETEEDSFWQSPSNEEGDCHHPKEGPHGFHVWSFWSSRYTWLPPLASSSSLHDYAPPHIRRRLAAHETEIFHIKAVTPDQPQYIGSDLHFSCGKEVQQFVIGSDNPDDDDDAAPQNTVSLQLQTTLHRVGHVWVYLPVTRTDHVRVRVGGSDNGQEWPAAPSAEAVDQHPHHNYATLWTVVGNTPCVSSNGSPQLVGRVIRIRVVVRADGSADDGWIHIQF